MTAARRVSTERLELRPLPAAAAAALPGDRAAAAGLIGAGLPDEWPQPDLLDALPMQAAASPPDEVFGVWVMVERESGLVVGDIGFLGPPDQGSMEIGYAVVPSRRRLGYAAEAAAALTAWAFAQPGVRRLTARCLPGNLGSIRTLERTGFRRDGEAHGELRWLREA